MLRVALLESVSDMQRKKPSCSNPSTVPGPQKGQDGGRGETLPKTMGAGAEVVRCGEDGGESTANPRPASVCGGGVGLFTLRPERTGLLCPETQRAFPPVTAPFHKAARPVVAR